MNLRWHICPLVVAAVFASCSPAKSESLSKNASKEYGIIINDLLIKWDDCLNQEESNYLVFVYSETCTHCHEIMGNVILFIEENIMKTYFVNKSDSANKINICPIDEVMVGIDEVDKLTIAGTPTLFEIEEGKTTANIFGSDACLTFLNEQRLNKKK